MRQQQHTEQCVADAALLSYDVPWPLCEVLGVSRHMCVVVCVLVLNDEQCVADAALLSYDVVLCDSIGVCDLGSADCLSALFRLRACANTHTHILQHTHIYNKCITHRRQTVNSWLPTRTLRVRC